MGARARCVLSGLACQAVWLCGCMVGPVALEAGRVGYNRAIQATTNEQLLLNLVRLQYREPPLFLEVGSVSAQFSVKHSADAEATLFEGPAPSGPNRLGFGTALSFEERPTVSFTPLQGRDFVSQLLAPLRPDLVVLLSRSGWRIDRVLRLTVQTMNGLDNASGASGPTPDSAPRYERFARVAELFRVLQGKGLLVIGYETTVEEIASFPADAIDPAQVLSATEAGYRLDRTENGGLTLSRPSRRLVWRVPAQASGSGEVAELVELLALDSRLRVFEIRPAAAGRTDGEPEREVRGTIDVSMRSLMGTLFYLSQSVEVPAAHRARGVVTTTVTPTGEPFDWRKVTGDLLRIPSAATRPRDTAVAVRHRGRCFFIADTDLTSKSTFGLLTQIFALQAGDVESVTPVLTLPIGG